MKWPDRKLDGLRRVGRQRNRSQANDEEAANAMESSYENFLDVRFQVLNFNFGDAFALLRD
jgi:hypothetical protein